MGSNVTRAPVPGWRNVNRTACNHCLLRSSRCDSTGSAPYVRSPQHGCFRADMWTRIWWVRPVSRPISSKEANRWPSRVW